MWHPPKRATVEVATEVVVGALLSGAEAAGVARVPPSAHRRETCAATRDLWEGTTQGDSTCTTAEPGYRSTPISSNAEIPRQPGNCSTPIPRNPEIPCQPAGRAAEDANPWRTSPKVPAAVYVTSLLRSTGGAVMRTTTADGPWWLESYSDYDYWSSVCAYRRGYYTPDITAA
jgi:hypothetical protein